MNTNGLLNRARLTGVLVAAAGALGLGFFVDQAAHTAVAKSAPATTGPNQTAPTSTAPSTAAPSSTAPSSTELSLSLAVKLVGPSAVPAATSRAATSSQQRREQRVMTARRRPRRDAALPTARWHDWSCLVRLVVTDAAALEPAAGDLRALMGRVERAASRFRPESELSLGERASRTTGGGLPAAGRLVDAALNAAARPAGAGPDASGRDLARLGYDRDISTVADSRRAAARRDERRAVGGRSGGPRRAGCSPCRPGLASTSAPSAKAQTADWAAAELQRRYGCEVLVEIGGDLAVAGGRRRTGRSAVAERLGDAGSADHACRRAGWPPRPPPSGAGWPAGRQRAPHRRSVPPAGRRTGPGGRSPSPPTARCTPTPAAPLRSCSERGRSAGWPANGSRPGWSAATAAS